MDPDIIPSSRTSGSEVAAFLDRLRKLGSQRDIT